MPLKRPNHDLAFYKSVDDVASQRRGQFTDKANLQPARRPDVEPSKRDLYGNANIFLGLHGTRAVNVQPILASNLRLPRSLKGVHISGAAFGHGIYFATDWRKSYGYTGFGNSYWGSGGTIAGRGFFLFLCDVVMGKAYMARGTGSWQKSPNGTDSVAAYPNYSSVANDEHIIFDPNYQRIRYLVECELR